MNFARKNLLNRWFATRSLGLVVFLLAIIALSVGIKKSWKKDNIKTLVNSDGKGYYAYLPNVFFYSDWSFAWYPQIEARYRGSQPPIAPFLNGIEEGFINKYNCGVAILLLPFFLLATFLASIFQLPVDGYSAPYMIAVSVGCLSWTMAGLYALGKWLAAFVSERSAALAVAAIFLGTPLFYYALFEPSISHAYTFSLICISLRLFQLSCLSFHWKTSLLFALCCGLIFLIRPTSILFLLFIPLHFKAWWKWILQHLRFPLALFMVLAFAGPFLLQCYFNYKQVGHTLVYAYGHETFNFAEPHIPEVLFGFRVGLFAYAPILLVALVAMLLMLYQKKLIAYRAVLFIFFYAYIISSWHAWHYEGTFGMRPFIDVLAVFAIPLAMAFDRISVFLKWILTPVFCTCILITQLLSWCRFQCIIPWSGMNADKYFVALFHPSRELAYRYTPIDFPPFPEKPKAIEFGFLPDTIMLQPYETRMLHRWQADTLNRQITLQCDVILEHNRSNAKFVLDEYSNGQCTSQMVRLGRAGAAQNERMWLQASFNFQPCDSIVWRFVNEHSARAEVSRLSWSHVEY